MKKIVTIVGARPQFVKAAVLSRLIKSRYSKQIHESIVHTGQHYDSNMSKIFFKEMNIPEPNINIGIGSGTHGNMTGNMLIEIEKILLQLKPCFVIVYGDTNSTFAGAIAASKLDIPVIHIEAGLRSYNKKMPEEQNRILTDHISSYLFCPTENAVENLTKEGIIDRVYLVGDIMYDASLYYRKFVNPQIDVKKKYNIEKYYLLTLHRAENTDDKEKLSSIISALNKFKYPCIFPIHPRTKKYLNKYQLKIDDHIKMIEPVGFFEMLQLEEACDFIVTDSGGVQKEAYFFKKPCLTLRDETEWIETVDCGWNRLVGSDFNRIIENLNNINFPLNYNNLYGSGNTGQQILEILINF